MAKRLILKLRPSFEEVSIGIPQLEQLLKQTDEAVAEAFRNVLKARGGAIHDKRWLELIAAHQVEGGKAVSEVIQWAGLRQKIDKLDPTLDGKAFTLSAAQDEMFKKRLKDPSFKVAALPPQFAAFLMDYCRTPPVWHFDENDAETWVDLDEEEASAGTPSKEIASGI